MYFYLCSGCHEHYEFIHINNFFIYIIQSVLIGNKSKVPQKREIYVVNIYYAKSKHKY